ncbi:lipoyl(octanoyl) transferase LipB [Salinicola rhizosphaerae]|uniref:Octanoyltransferase n=1 Tax=Salinicola rhizosphaerae TaxID=1443141 RepID=A0ABQ3DPP7_9GAMM|nr:lipoyl(octanoyl) transferase LipB [Salinicola rhizosphaerae]GHB10815.1 octanoyltransferase [Salinicola rhizosphaerae]
MLLECYRLGRRDYLPIWQAMRDFTDTRDSQTPDQLWWVEHEPVFTQGRAGKAEHVLMPGDIPVVASDRGGQVTYHGPGQIVVYPLLDVRRAGLGVRELVSLLEESVIDALSQHGIEARARADAPGVYVGDDKIASLGLRIRRGCSFHGVALNVDMDLAPFARINPCGYAGLKMTQLRDWVDAPLALSREADRLTACIARRLGAEAHMQSELPAALMPVVPV